MKIPYMVASNSGVTYHCKWCESYLPSEKFYSYALQSRARKCKQCWVEQVRKSRQTKAPYNSIVQHMHLHYKHSQLENNDIQYLISSVWNNTGIAHGKESPNEKLTFVIWDETETFTPWNIVLVTRKLFRVLKKDNMTLKQYVSKLVLEQIMATLQKVKLHYTSLHAQ